jgi:hydrogenase-4 component B
MPWTAGLFAFGSMAISGLPALNGFVSEWLVYLGLFGATMGRGLAAWAALPATLALAIAGALALASFIKAGAVVFLGAPRTKSAVRAHECGDLMRGPMIALAAACATIGVAPALVWPAIAHATAAWHPTWRAMEMPAPLGTLGPVAASVALLAIIAGAWLWRRARRNGVKPALTWDCGYAAPSARMQYTSGSFGNLASHWFFWILRPERKLRRPRGIFPASAIRVERVPETVLERVVVPSGAAVLRVSTAVRRLQHGRLQSYIFYLVAGLVAIAAIVVAGGVR